MPQFFPAKVPFWLPQSSTTQDFRFFDQATKWTAATYQTDVNRTSFLIKNGQLTTVIADGPTLGSQHFTNNNYAAMVLFPKFPGGAPVLGDNILKVTFSVDPHLTGRRWIELVAFDSRDNLIYPNETKNTTPKHALGPGGGQYLQWVIDGNGHELLVKRPGNDGTGINETTGIDLSWGPRSDRFNPKFPNVGRTPGQFSAKNNLNGTQALLGIPRKFTLYLSRTYWRIEEGGLLIKQGAFTRPLEFDKVNFGFIHMAYHLSLEHQELLNYSPQETVFIKQPAPYSDARVWDDFDIEYVTGFPALN